MKEPGERNWEHASTVSIFLCVYPVLQPVQLTNVRRQRAGGHNVVMKKRGFLNPEAIWQFSFWTISACLLVAVVASILAIWQFAGTDALWRTVATCLVIGAGTLAFSWVNGLFGADDWQQRQPPNDDRR